MLPPDPDAPGGTGVPSTDTVAPVDGSGPGLGEPDRDGTAEVQESRWPSWTRSRWVWGLGAFVFVLVSVIGASFVVKVPYYAFSPGSVYDTNGLVTVSAPEVDDPDGEMLLTTISVSRRRLTAWDAFVGWLDPTVSVFPEEVVVGDRDRETVRQENILRMTSSQDVATYVALERLGYDVGLTGTGVQVTAVQPGSAADGVLEYGDTIVAIDGEPVEIASDLIGIVSARAPGDTLELTVEPLASEDQDDIELVLGSRPDDPEVPLIGIELQTRDGAFVLPDDIDVTFADRGIGGPSAGLVFTLTIMDDLSPGDLTGGATIAFTGEILADGRVGAIGGIEQKAVTVRRAGVEVFIVPATIPEPEMEAARRQAGDAVEIIEVATLDEALDALEALGGDPLVEVDQAA